MKSTYGMAALIVLVLGVWLASGQLKQENGEVELALDRVERDGSPRTGVRTRVQHAEHYPIEVRLRGRTEAKRVVSVRSETSGQVIGLPVQKGAVVREGELLCELALEDRDIKFEEAKAGVLHAGLEYEAALKLARQGFQHETQIADLRAKLISARANLRRRQLDLDNREIRSPFEGIIEDRMVDIGDYIQRGEICVDIIDPNPLLVVAHITEKDVGRVRVGTPANAQLVTGERISGRVSFIGHSADPATRTYRIEVEFDNPDYSLRDGLSAELHLPLDSVLAHRVSPALLALGDDGDIGVRIIDDENIVRFVRVSILNDTQDGVWLTGLPDTIRLITLGHEYVYDSQKLDGLVGEE